MIVASATWWIWGKPGWGTAELWAAAILLLPSAVSILLAVITRGKRRPRFFSRLISGMDGKWSTSKACYLFWTYALLFAGVATLVHRGDLGSIFAHLQPEYMVILGIPASTGAAAKAIRNQNPGANGSGSAADPNTNPVSGISELVADDEGDTALHKFQYLAFNLLLLGFFFAQFFASENGGLPKLPPTLVGPHRRRRRRLPRPKGPGDGAGNGRDTPEHRAARRARHCARDFDRAAAEVRELFFIRTYGDA